MKLRKIKVSNFRSFADEMSIEIDDLTALVGANSSGKTSFLQALVRMFGDTTAEREIKKSDFHIPSNVNPNTINENSFYLESIFEFEEVIGGSGIAKYSVPSNFENFIINSKTGVPYIRIRLEATWTRSNQPEGIIDYKMYYITKDEGETFEDKDKKTISKSNLSLIKVIYVPAVRDPNVQLRNATGSILWRLLNGINISDEFKNSINEKISEVNEDIGNHEGISIIRKFVEEQWQNYHKYEKYKNIDFIYNTTDIDSILKKIEPHFSPTETGNNYTVEDIGDGLRSLFYFSLVGTLLKAEEETMVDIINNPSKKVDDRIFSMQPPCITIVAVEEPENHISPHLLGKVIMNLRYISKNINSQVIMSSHSASIIRRVDPTEIRHFRNCTDKLCTVVNKILLPEKKEDEYKYVKESVRAYPEIYFSSLVILGEGDSEEVIIPKLFDIENIEINTNEIAIVPLGGRHVNHFWKLLEQIGIPYITLLDLDLERNGGGWGRIKYALEQLIMNGYKKEELLEISGGKILSDDELKKMHDWDQNQIDNMDAWIKDLEKYEVFFSYPLDLDFMMLKIFKDQYLAIINSNEGPVIDINGATKRISELSTDELKSKEYDEKIKESVQATLKNEKKVGECYSLVDRQLMIWYKYLFLYRGKPVMHRLAINNIDDSVLKAQMPEVFKRLIKIVKKQLRIGSE